MKRPLAPLALFSLLGLLGVPGAVLAGSAAPPAAWGPAIEVPGTAALNHGNGLFTDVNSISCPAAGNCAAGGLYEDGSGNYRGFVVDETNGTWSNAIEVPGTGAVINENGQGVSSISCATAGNCVAGGGYSPGEDTNQPFVVDEISGSWGKARTVPGMATLNSGGDGAVFSISCPAAGNCTAGGYYFDESQAGGNEAFVVDEKNGVWGKAIEVPGTGKLNSGEDAEVTSISCPTPGNCAAGGYYTDGSDLDNSHQQVFVVDEKNGVWGTAIEVPGTATLNTGGGAELLSVSCGAAGNCSATGSYTARHGRGQAFVADETNGSWGRAIEVPGTATLNRGVDAFGNSVSCASAGNCAAVGDYRDSHGNYQAWVADETNGRWGNASNARGTATVRSRGGWVQLNAVSCATAGNCSGGGSEYNRPCCEESFVLEETNGTWGTPVVVPGTATLNRGGSAEVSSISCATTGGCAAGGDYADSSGDTQVFVAGSAPPSSLNPNGTNCNGPYAGAGENVVVPTGGTCTLVPGTRVAGDVTVSIGGTLYATGVTIGGVLEVAGGATICGSRVLSDVKAVSAGGALNLGGGPGCIQGNTLVHDVVVKHDRHDVWIWDNTIAGDLIVLNSHGKADSIRSNTVGNLLVAHSGPVVVVANHASGNIECIANKRQRGHGNKARRHNTCPK